MRNKKVRAHLSTARALFKLYFVDNRKTTILGLGGIGTGLGVMLKSFPWGPHSFELFYSGVTAFFSGVGLVLGKDAKTVDEAPTSADPAQVPPTGE